MPFEVYKPNWPPAPVHQALAAIVSIVLLGGCSSGPKVPDWKINAIGHIELALQEPLATLPYAQSRALGSLVLVDTASHKTSGAVLVNG